MHQHQDEEAQQDASPAAAEPDAMRLGAIEGTDPSLTPLLAVVVSRFMRSDPLPPS